MVILFIGFSYTQLVAVRFLLSLVLLLFLPGFNVLEMLDKSVSLLTGLHRFLISVGVSLAIAILTSYVLSYTGVTLNEQNLTASIGGEVLALTSAQYVLYFFKLLPKNGGRE